MFLLEVRSEEVRSQGLHFLFSPGKEDEIPEGMSFGSKKKRVVILKRGKGKEKGFGDV